MTATAPAPALISTYTDPATGITLTLDTSGIVTSSCGDSVETYFDNTLTLQLFDALYSTPERVSNAALAHFNR